MPTIRLAISSTSPTAAIPEEMQEQFGLDDFVDATPREALAVAGKKVKKENPSQADQLKKLSLVVLDVKEYGNSASVHVSLIFQGREADERIKLVKVEGEFVWHKHDAEDELFLVVSGQLAIDFRDKHIRRFKIAVNDSDPVGMLHRLANLDQQFEALVTSPQSPPSPFLPSNPGWILS